MTRGMSLEAYVEDLAYLFNVSKPVIIYNCEETCPKSAACTWIGCYKHGVGSINVKTGYEGEVLVNHEFGHHLFHALYPGRCNGGSLECEEYAMDFEEWAYEMSRQSDTYTLFRCGCGEILQAEKVYSVAECPRCGAEYVVGADGSIRLLVSAEG
jgi:predicted RNA-binding Zn-ribbon protein involved in translation (DUF1610 family)